MLIINTKSNIYRTNNINNCRGLEASVLINAGYPIITGSLVNVMVLRPVF